MQNISTVQYVQNSNGKQKPLLNEITFINGVAHRYSHTELRWVINPMGGFKTGVIQPREIQIPVKIFSKLKKHKWSWCDTYECIRIAKLLNN